jgi:peptidoglycan glycosyltransferase
VVLVENGGGGSSVAGSVAGKVLNVMVNGYEK